MRSSHKITAMLLMGLLSIGGATGWNHCQDIQSQKDVPAIGSVQVQQGDTIIFKDFPVFETVEAMTNEADLVVVGKVQAKAGSRNLARNPLNPAEEAADRKLMSQEYEFIVETTLKGQEHKEILIVYPEFTILPSGEKSPEPQVPLELGQRYVLSLKSGIEGTFYGIGEPWQFKLNAGQAQALSVLSVSEALKAVDEASLIQQIKKFAK